jgi:cytoskeletal protein RodZ
MPLDTGGLTDLEYRAEEIPASAGAEPLPPSINSGANIGAALRAVREFKGLSLEDVAETTRVRRAYLAAIEDMRMEALPSRPFTIGYVRAYALALGVDGDTAVRRFRQDVPDPDQALPEPLGVQSGRDPRLMLVGVAGAAIIAAIFVWNVAQRVLSEKQPEAPPVAAAPSVPAPPPAESTTPPPYETPGLQAAAQAAAVKAAEERGEPPPPVVIEVPKPAPKPADLPAAFVAQGQVYGPPPAEASSVVLQARKAASIVVRGSDGTVYFARQLAAGEAYRAPALPGVAVDVSDPEAFQVFAAGESKGLLPAGATQVGKLAQ